MTYAQLGETRWASIGDDIQSLPVSRTRQVGADLSGRSDIEVHPRVHALADEIRITRATYMLEHTAKRRIVLNCACYKPFERVGDLDQRLYYLQNWRHDVAALMTHDGVIKEKIIYDAYGRPHSFSPGDITGGGSSGRPDGVMDGTDVAAWSSGTAAWNKDIGSSSDVAKPDGIVDIHDYYTLKNLSGTFTGGWDLLGDSSVGNRKGYAGYEFDTVLQGAGGVDTKPVYHVRHRVLAADTGKWFQKDPLGYHDSMDLYEYCASDPEDARDEYGLCGTSCKSKGIPIAETWRPDGYPTDLPPLVIPSTPAIGENTLERCTSVVTRCKATIEWGPWIDLLEKKIKQKGCPIPQMGIQISCVACKDSPLRPLSKATPNRFPADGEDCALTTPGNPPAIKICYDTCQGINRCQTYVHELVHYAQYCDSSGEQQSIDECIMWELQAYTLGGNRCFALYQNNPRELGKCMCRLACGSCGQSEGQMPSCLRKCAAVMDRLPH